MTEGPREDGGAVDGASPGPGARGRPQRRSCGPGGAAPPRRAPPVPLRASGQRHRRRGGVGGRVLPREAAGARRQGGAFRGRGHSEGAGNDGALAVSTRSVGRDALPAALPRAADWTGARAGALRGRSLFGCAGSGEAGGGDPAARSRGCAPPSLKGTGGVEAPGEALP